MKGLGQLRSFITLLIGRSSSVERLILKLLDWYYTHRFRMQWRCNFPHPHFEDRRILIFDFAFTDKCCGPYPFYNGFFNSEIIRRGDRLLDIGCGDGFLTRRFYSELCSSIDAVDISPEAINYAKRANPARNIKYYLWDAAERGFPSDKYDVICWDGALGHFNPDRIAKVLKKIADSLSEDGIFVGSESLGVEGHDHSQFFHSLDELQTLLQPFFKYVDLKEVNYTLRWANDFERTEAYWRCSFTLARQRTVRWMQCYSIP